MTDGHESRQAKAAAHACGALVLHVSWRLAAQQEWQKWKESCNDMSPVETEHLQQAIKLLPHLATAASGHGTQQTGTSSICCSLHMHELCV